MKNCEFQSLLLLSLRERAGRLIRFDPNLTVIRGANDTGKSCLVKTIYHTLGATPPQIPPTWKDAEVRSLLRFTLDGVPHAMLRSQDRYTLFDGDGALIVSTTRVTSELAPAVAERFEAGLHLQARDGSTVPAPPAFLFLPYYVDQDSGWKEAWDSFAGLSQFSNWKKDVMDYHLGLKPDEYYHAKGELARIIEMLKSLRVRRDALVGVRDELQTKLGQVDFTLDVVAYQREVEELLIVCNRLRAREEEIKRTLTQLYNQQATLSAQVAIVGHAGQELAADYRFAASLPDEVECPTCGVIHQNSFIERFDLARDSSECDELLLELRTRLDECNQRISGVSLRYGATTADLQRAEALLATREGELTLGEIIENAGRIEARDLLRSEIESVNKELKILGEEERNLTAQMERFNNREHRERVRRYYHRCMQRFLTDVNVTALPEKQIRSFDARIPGSGSELPRSLLAYYFAILHTMDEQGGGVRCPIVIDSPRQQDQDRINWAAILRLIRDQRPAGSQMIVALADDEGVELPGLKYDLTEKRGLLLTEEYRQVLDEVGPYMDESLKGGLF